jgi:serine/threonine protein kinase
MAQEPGHGIRTIASRYELLDELGRGGMGVVWRARDRSLEREVAIKEVRVPDHLTPQERGEAHARILREAQTAARIQHPSVITIHDIFDADGSPWVVMERVHGRTLQQKLNAEGPLSTGGTREIAEAMLGALAAAHAAGVVHRDVKPGNILLAEDGRIILTDFGIATVEGATALTRTGTMIGSPEYMSPERLEQDQVTPACDLWSLGAVLHACTEGRSPFHRETITATITAVVALPIPEASHAGPLAPVIATTGTWKYPAMRAFSSASETGTPSISTAVSRALDRVCARTPRAFVVAV